MPYFIQFVKDLSTRVETVQKSTEDIKKKDVQKAEEEMNRPLDMDMNFMFPGMGMNTGAPLSIMPAPGMMPQTGQFMTAPAMNMGGMGMSGMGMGGMGMNMSGMQFK